MSKAQAITNGSLIRLHQAENIVGISEGIENSLAIHQATNLPMYAATFAHYLETAEFDARIQHVFIFADLDRKETGQKSAQILSERLREKQDISSTIYYPPGPILPGKKGTDWNDILELYGERGFPYPMLFKQNWTASLAHSSNHS